jgi:hypothetical protein
MTAPTPPLAHAFAFPYPLNTVDSPRLVYGQGPTALHYLDREDVHHVRLTFEGLDSLRVCRGEYLPYEEAPSELGYTGVYLIEGSPWLRERYDYEASHYRERSHAGARSTSPSPQLFQYVGGFLAQKSRHVGTVRRGEAPGRPSLGHQLGAKTRWSLTGRPCATRGCTAWMRGSSRPQRLPPAEHWTNLSDKQTGWRAPRSGRTAFRYGGFGAIGGWSCRLSDCAERLRLAIRRLVVFARK